MTKFREARQFLLDHRLDYETAYGGFKWPDEPEFNWALDWFDTALAGDPHHRDRSAIRILDRTTGEDTSLSFGELSMRSNQVANWLSGLGVRRGDRILLALGNVLPLWEIMLAAIKLGAVVIPATPLLPETEFADRVERGNAKLVVTEPDHVAKIPPRDGLLRVVVGAQEVPGDCIAYAPGNASRNFRPVGRTRADDPLFCYFTSGTTSRPKLVLHSHRSYPVGHLSTMYWIGLRPDDVHLNISSPGWAKHAWSSFFAPWNAGATIFVLNQGRFDARDLLDVLRDGAVTTLCAPPTVWRLLIQQDLGAWTLQLRELVGAGEPLNPEVIERVRKAWGLTIRDGYGQSETTAQIGNPPGQPIRIGSMGRPLPGYRPMLLDSDDRDSAEGEIALPTGSDKPAGLMQGYDAGDGTVRPFNGVYRTGDVASLDEDGYLTFVGRADDVFKSSDYRISPFELESALIEDARIAEAAVVPSPDPVRLAVPKAYIALVPGLEPSAELAEDIFRHIRKTLAPFRRVRKIEFVDDLPKTISGKIRRVELRAIEAARDGSGTGEFDEAQFEERLRD